MSRSDARSAAAVRVSRPAAVLLDAGNTLFTERPARHVLYAEAARRRGLAVDDLRMRAIMREVHDALPLEIDGAFRYGEAWFRCFIQEVFARLDFAGDRGAMEVLVAELFATFERKETFATFPETRAVLKRVKGAGIPLAVVSNWSPRLPRVLGVLEMLGDFDAVVTSAVVRIEKPDPRIFRRAAELLGVDIADCVHAGDHPVKDVEGAEAAGATAWLVDRAGAHPDHPRRVMSLAELLPRVGLRAD